MGPAGELPPPRRIALVVVNAALVLWGVLAFVSGFLVRYGSDAGSDFGFSVKGFSYSSTTLLPAILVGTLGIVGVTSRRGPRQVYLFAATGAIFAVEVGELFTYSDDFRGQSRGGGYWLLFVAVVLELLTTAVGSLVQTGVISIAARRPVPAGYAPYGAAPGYAPAPYGSPPYGTPAYGTPAYGTPAYGTPAYGTPVYGTAPSPYAPPSPYTPPPGGGYTGPPPTGGGRRPPTG